MSEQRHARILVIDDNRAIHQDFAKILVKTKASTELENSAALVFGSPSIGKVAEYRVEFASQGQEGVEMIRKAMAENDPYAMAFVDMRMPPGWDGLETIEHAWKVCPDLQVVICTAYSDYPWDEVSSRLGLSDSVLILKKPFDNVEVSQLASALIEKSRLKQEARLKLDALNKLVWERTRDLEKKVSEYEIASWELVSKEGELSELFENAPVAIHLMDPEGRIVRANQAELAMLGYARDEYIGRHVSDFYVDAEEADSIINRVISQDLMHGVEARLRHKDGSIRNVIMDMNLLLKDGKIVHGRCFTRDLTDRIHNEESQRAQRALTDAVAAMQQVIGVVGHELRTPLAGLRIISELLLDQGVSDANSMASFLQSINSEVIRMSNMVNNMLEAARLSSGAARWNWSNFDLMSVCSQAVDAARPLVDASRIQLNCVVDPPDLTMDGDSDAVRRLILNLVGNAQKHTVDGSIAVRASAKDDAEGKWIEIEIADTGEGISPQIAEKLGQAFALNSGIVGGDHVKGSGLGLAICKGIVAAHGGAMSVKSALGHGTVVTVRLKADLSQAVAFQEVGIHREIAS